MYCDILLSGAAIHVVCCRAYDQSERKQPVAGQHELTLVLVVDGRGRTLTDIMRRLWIRDVMLLPLTRLL